MSDDPVVVATRDNIDGILRDMIKGGDHSYDVQMGTLVFGVSESPLQAGDLDILLHDRTSWKVGQHLEDALRRDFGPTTGTFGKPGPPLAEFVQKALEAYYKGDLTGEQAVAFMQAAAESNGQALNELTAQMQACEILQDQTEIINEDFTRILKEETLRSIEDIELHPFPGGTQANRDTGGVCP